MKFFKLVSILLPLTLSSHGTYAAAPASHKETAEVRWGAIDTRGLEALIKAKIPMSVVDARTDQWFDGTIITGAQRLPMDATKEVVEKTLPNKNQLVVVYCAGEGCPASKMLAKRLEEEGYANVIDYHGGIHEWTSHHKPTEKI